ncbi:MAG: hypothetical protein U5L45_01000 [Saprospiraceae bacterium]|nr:hypothetical protein [Saprospiraceae bacterium]
MGVVNKEKKSALSFASVESSPLLMKPIRLGAQKKHLLFELIKLPIWCNHLSGIFPSFQTLRGTGENTMAVGLFSYGFSNIFSHIPTIRMYNFVLFGKQIVHFLGILACTFNAPSGTSGIINCSARHYAQIASSQNRPF